MIPDPLLSFAESAINRAIQTDVLAAAELAALEGKSFAIECIKPPLSLSLEAGAEGVDLIPGSDEDASVVLRGDLPALVSLAYSVARDKSDFSSSGVEIRGDVGALLLLSRTLSRLEIDWEDLLAKFIGEIPARFVFLGKSRLENSKPLIKEKVSEVSASFLAERVGVARAGQSHQLREDLRQLQYRIDRVQARIRDIESVKNAAQAQEITD